MTGGANHCEVFLVLRNSGVEVIPVLSQGEESWTGACCLMHA